MKNQKFTRQSELIVNMAEEYRYKKDDLLRNADYMLLQQHNFPHVYGQKDILLIAHSGTFEKYSSEFFYQLLGECTGGGVEEFENWALAASVDDMFRFLIALFEVNHKDKYDLVDWTGYRVCVGDTENGPVYFFELFAQHKDSMHPVYSGATAAVPNVCHLNR